MTNHIRYNDHKIYATQIIDVMSKKYTENDNQRQANLQQHLSENNFFHYTVMIQKKHFDAIQGKMAKQLF